MSEAAQSIYDSLDSWEALEALVDDGEAEGVHLECKAPQGPKLNQGLKLTLAQIVSGFSNTNGGVVIWGMGTTKHPHSEADVLNEISPIGNARNFERNIQSVIASLTNPGVVATESKTLRETRGSTRGVVVTYIPESMGDPVQVVKDDKFYLRLGDAFHPMPYSMIQRMFTAAQSPDMEFFIRTDLATRDDSGQWRISLAVANRSSRVADHAVMTVEIDNAESFETITASDLNDISSLNPGVTLFQSHMDHVIHRGMPRAIGDLQLTPKPRIRSLKLIVRLFADGMRAKRTNISINLKASGLEVTESSTSNLY